MLKTLKSLPILLVIAILLLLPLVSCSNLPSDTHSFVKQLVKKTDQDLTVWSHDKDMGKNVFYMTDDQINYAFVDYNCFQYFNSQKNVWTCIGVGSQEFVFADLRTSINKQQKRLNILEWNKTRQANIQAKNSSAEVSSNKEIQE
jgi:hypothetical protein